MLGFRVRENPPIYIQARAPFVLDSSAHLLYYFKIKNCSSKVFKFEKKLKKLFQSCIYTYGIYTSIYTCIYTGIMHIYTGIYISAYIYTVNIRYVQYQEISFLFLFFFFFLHLSFFVSSERKYFLE